MSEEIKPGFYLAVKDGRRPGVCEYVVDAGVPHWRNFQDDRMSSDPRHNGWKLFHVDSIVEKFGGGK